MKTALITGGTDGIGKGMAIHYLEKGYRVYVVGSSNKKGNEFVTEMNNPALTFIQADLSLISENQRVIDKLSRETTSLDALVLCAASLKPQPAYIETTEGIEFTFALYYLSRYILSYQLKSLMEKAKSPVIINVCAPGMKGTVHWNDLQMKECYKGLDAQFHGSRLNDLLAVSFHQKDTIGKIKYILFNPMAARTPGAKKMGGDSKMMKLYYKFFGKDVDELVNIIMKNIENTNSRLAAFKLEKKVDLKMGTFDPQNAQKLSNYTQQLLSAKQ